VLPDGTILNQKEWTRNYRAQLVHASPDPAVSTVDVYFDGGLLIDDFAFRSATPFLTLPAGRHEFDFVTTDHLGVRHVVASYNDVVYNDGTNSFVLAGVVNPEDWPSNPDGLDTRLGLFTTSEAVEGVSNENDWAVQQFYGVSDMPAVDFWMDALSYRVFDDLEYCQFSGLVTAADLCEATGCDPVFDTNLVGAIRLAGGDASMPVVSSSESNWSDYEGESVLEVVTGLMDARACHRHGGSDGCRVQWFYVRPDGSILSPEELQVGKMMSAEVEIPVEFAVSGNYPNPFNPSTSITFDLPDAASVRVQVFDATGRMLMETEEATFAAGAGHAVQLDATAWGSGLYLYKVIARARTSSWIGSGRMMLVK
jgi:hypothetical protein